MRITRDTLLKIVRDTVKQRTRADRSLLSIYLCGSLQDDDFLLGGATDIDLVLIHTDLISQDREVVPLTEDIHLDIAHHYHRDYRQPRALRLHPWMGPTIKRCQILYDPQHFMDFTQASVRGQYEKSDFVVERSRKLFQHARQIWSDFHIQRSDPGPKEILTYLRAIDHAVNAICSLNGAPLTERRFLSHFPKRAEDLKRPGMQAAVLGLLGGPHAEAETLQSWLTAWDSAYLSIGPDAPARLHPARKSYYLKAMSAQIESDTPLVALWPLLRTWTLAVSLLPADADPIFPWQNAMLYLGLKGEAFNERVEALDFFLDLVDEILEDWARANGAEFETF